MITLFADRNDDGLLYGLHALLQINFAGPHSASQGEPADQALLLVFFAKLHFLKPALRQARSCPPAY